MLTDCHIHLSLFADPQAVCNAAAFHRIRLVGVGCDVADSERNIVCARAFGSKAMIGIHPWYARSGSFPFDDFERLFAGGMVCGVGECGLDAGIDLDLNTQIMLLRGHLDFASAHDLPVNLHIRKCHGTLIRLLKEYKGRLRGIVHNFTFSKEIAREYLNLNLYLSVGHHVLYRSKKLCETLSYAGPQKVLLETDVDEIHSGPYDPELIVKEEQAMAEIFGLTDSSLEDILERNYVELMGSDK